MVQTFCAKFAGLLQRRHSRLQSRALARRAEGYREMVDRIRQKKLSTPPVSQQRSLPSLGHRNELRLLSVTPPPEPFSSPSGGDVKAAHSRSRSSTVDWMPGERGRTHSDESEERKRAQLTVHHLQARQQEKAKQRQEEHKEAAPPLPLPSAVITR